MHTQTTYGTGSVKFPTKKPRVPPRQKHMQITCQKQESKCIPWRAVCYLEISASQTLCSDSQVSHIHRSHPCGPPGGWLFRRPMPLDESLPWSTPWSSLTFGQFHNERLCHGSVLAALRGAYVFAPAQAAIFIAAKISPCSTRAKGMYPRPASLAPSCGSAAQRLRCAKHCFGDQGICSTLFWNRAK